ncbi:hypothetical protein SUGI_1037580 [Cryptomeria japonica]|nr:hypothetical protein SUGI_1037580 [Cryptomeria japonica]
MIVTPVIMEERRRKLGFPSGGVAQSRGWDHDLKRMVYQRPWIKKKFQRPPKDPSLGWISITTEIRSVSICIESEAWKESVLFLRERAFFMKWGGEWLAFPIVRNWVNEEWGNHFEIKTLTNGFFLIIAGSAEEKTALMESGPFFMSGVGFYIRDWTPNFDPRQDTIEEIPVWIRLYNLPHEYWKEEIFKSVGEKIGRFIKSD